MSSQENSGSLNFSRRVRQAEKTLETSIQSVKGRRKMRGTNERIDRLRLFQKLLTNIRLNEQILSSSCPVELRINQLQALQGLIDFLQREGLGNCAGYFVQPSGAGKTVLYGMMARLMNVQTLVLVPRTNLLEQVQRDWSETLGIDEKSMGIVSEHRDELGQQYTITTYQGHVSRMRRDPRYRSEIQRCELVICDEAHKALGPDTRKSIDDIDMILDSEMTKADERSEQKVFSHLQQLTNTRSLKLGFTATPRLVNKSVQDQFQTLISHTPHSDLVRAGILAKFKVLQIPAFVKPTEVQQNITTAQEIRMLKREDIYRKALEALQKLRDQVHERLLTVAFCPSIRECDRLQEVARLFDLKCSIVTNREYRTNPGIDHICAAETAIQNGDIDLIASVDKLQVGWDYPPINTILQLRATLSAAIVAQEAGRAARTCPGKDTAYIIEPSWQRIRPPIETTNRGNLRIHREDVLKRKPQRQGEEDADEGSSPFYWETISKRKKSKEGKRGSNKREEEYEVVSRKLKYHKTPLTFAEALHLLGEEEVGTVCEGVKGEKLKYGSVAALDENGTVIIGNEVGVGLNAYSLLHGLIPSTVLKEAHEANLEIIGVALSLNKYVPVYRLQEVLALPYVIHGLQFERLSEGGEILIDGMACVSEAAFASLIGVSASALRKHVEQAGLQPVSKGICHGRPIDVYRKSAIESLPFVQIRTTIKPVDPESRQISIHGKVCMGLKTFSERNGVSYQLLETEVAEAKIQPEGEALSGSQKIYVFPVRKLEKLPCIKDRISLPRLKEGEAEVEIRGTTCIAINAFCSLHPEYEAGSIYRGLENNGIQHYGFALSVGNHRVRVFRKSDVERLPYIKKRSS